MASDDYGGKINPKAKVDRISNLPDEIISQILSLLPTKCAVGTSILSNRWKYLWTSITSLHFKSPIAKDKDFANFVDKVFRSCHSSNIQKFSFYANFWLDDSRVEAWIDEAIKRNVREMDINVWTLPLSIFSCTTLTVLTLVIPFITALDICSFDLPYLKALHFFRGDHSKRLMEKVINCCPVLEDLSVEGSFGYDNMGSIFMVDAPTLKSLRLQLWGIGDREISVKAPNLKYLYLSGTFVKYKIKGDFSSLFKANVNIEDIHLSSLYNPFHLERRDLPYGFTLPKFDNLKCLEVITCHHLFWVALPKLIRISQSLEVLSIKQCGDKMPPDEFTWIGPKRAKCMRNHLSTVKIEGFKGTKHELELVSYFLGDAKGLQRLIINSPGLDYDEELQFCVQLQKISKASKCCRVHFQGNEIFGSLDL